MELMKILGLRCLVKQAPGFIPIVSVVKSTKEVMGLKILSG